MLIVLYLSAIVIANLLVAYFGPGVAIFNAFFFIALDLTTRDTLHERWHHQHLWRNMALLIGAGSLLSAFTEVLFAALFNLQLDVATIAAASFTAFLAAGAVDTLVYTLLDGQSKLVKMNGSNLASAAVDSFLFLYLAFGIFPGFWSIVAGQFVAKVVGGFIWSLILRRRAR